MKLLKIALYARVSSDKQAQEKTIDSQIESIKELIQESGGKLEPDLIFCDNGVSGATLIRPALESLRDRAFAGDISQIYIHNPDRLARKYAHQLILIEEFQRLNVEIIFVNKSISQTPEDQMLLQIQGVISEYEREKITERCRRGKLYAAKKGSVNALVGAPFGYIYIKASKEKNAYYEIHHIEADIVKECYDLYCKDLLSISAIAQRFIDKGYLTRTGKTTWHPTAVWNILRNPAYMGQAEYGKRRLVERQKITKNSRDNSLYPKRVKSSFRETPKEGRIRIPVPKIIDAEFFERAAERLEKNKTLSIRNNKKHDYLVSSITRCAQCGYSVYGKPATDVRPGPRRYYRCLGQDNYRWRGGKVCKAQPVRAEIIDELVWQTTKRLISSPELVIKEYANRVDKRKNEADSREQILNKKKLELGCAEREKERMLDLYQFGKLELNEIEHRLKNIRTKIQNIHQEIDFLKHEEEIDSQRLQLVQRFEDFCSTLTINLEKLSFAERNKIIRLLVTDVIIDTLNGEITVNHILPLDQKMCPLGSRTHVNFLSFGCKFRYLVRWSFLKNRLYLTYKLFCGSVPFNGISILVKKLFYIDN